MALYSFTSALLSSSASNPAPVTSSLSGSGVNIISLSAPVDAIVFNPVTTLNSVLSSCTINGCVLAIDTAYSGSVMALADVPTRTYTVFTYNSAYTAVPLSAVAYASTTDISTSDQRRLRLLGYC
jgi:hypothetical protein